MDQVLLSIPYLVAAVLFILSLKGLSSQETARRGNLYGIIGMAIAVGATMTSHQITSQGLVYVGIAVLIGAAIGAVMAARVAMTSMPELVALLHSFVGAAAVLVGFASYFGEHGETVIGVRIHLTEIYLAVWIGAITFTGSLVAFGKLCGKLSGRPLLLPGRHLLNLAAVVGSLAIGVYFVLVAGPVIADGVLPLVIATAIALFLGYHLVAAIGGADMPVVVSLLNSYSGWTAAAAGFMLSNDLLIVTGALVGASGAILSYVMCKAMNRSIVNVVFGGFGAAPAPTAGSGEAAEQTGTITETTVAELADELQHAKSVVIVPGYGMAVARAQHAVREVSDKLRAKGVNVRFAIHPVAGRLPGHMNVLLAEASVPYDIVLEMDEINDDLPQTDVVLVIGANDIVNPSALTDPNSPIAGMPVLEVWEADRVVMLKRGRSAGYAGVDNPLFYYDNTHMLFGDAHNTMNALVGAL
ncbi:NAD(P)(+) transhydrogenase (Re/Si-specific) subunit beta [Posidoniimonas polymericola]|uniref:NAD(P)(+) transhydrogenase (Re/Si-specific) subunit beta n=1 Tax=Posidoniimonas polymericola TaxID=2528002 RepID=UPI0011B450FE|nr:NAD(P)(+) transhydrogenase (Re/Si-specific) subunit beta [Posidoniimonas polymericola]